MNIKLNDFTGIAYVDVLTKQAVNKTLAMNWTHIYMEAATATLNVNQSNDVKIYVNSRLVGTLKGQC